MTLPDYLKPDDGGFIYLTGHRIGLHHIVRMYGDGASAEMIAAYYPTLPLALIHHVIGFYLDNQQAIDLYVSEHQREIERQVAEGTKAPSIDELRARLTRIQTPITNPG